MKKLFLIALLFVFLPSLSIASEFVSIIMPSVHNPAGYKIFINRDRIDYISTSTSSYPSSADEKASPYINVKASWETPNGMHLIALKCENSKIIDEFTSLLIKGEPSFLDVQKVCTNVY